MKMMNLKFLTVAFALIAFTLAGTSCGNGESEGDQKSEEHEHMENGDHEHMDGDDDHSHMDEGTDMEMEHVHEGDHEMNWSVTEQDGKAIATGYLNIKNALVNTDQEKATAAANSLLDATDGMEGGDDLENFRAHVQELANGENVSAQRQAFEHLSEHVYLLAKSNDLGITVYKQFCPMAFDNEGAYWLSAEEEILNPYFGDKMMHCGEVQETIAAK